MKSNILITCLKLKISDQAAVLRTGKILTTTVDEMSVKVSKYFWTNKKEVVGKVTMWRLPN
jgi:hypothetical protein